MQTPETSTTLLRCLGQDAQSARWGDFVERYEPVMRAFLASRFPFVPADDIMQETLVALVRAMPTYVYSPKEHGHFHNYLLGILRNKALHHLRDRRREEDGLKSLACGQEPAPSEDDVAEEAFRESIYELALAELLADPAIRPQSKQIFLRVAVNGEKPESVASAFGVTRNSVDQTKNRLVGNLAEWTSTKAPGEMFEYICKGNAYNGNKLQAFRADFSPHVTHGLSFYSLGFRLAR